MASNPRDIVSNYTDGDTTNGILIDVSSNDANAYKDLVYAETPEFKIVKSSRDVTGFSATSHYRISHLHKDLNDVVAANQASLNFLTQNREDGDNALTGNLSTAISERISDVSRAFDARESDHTARSNSLSDAIADRESDLIALNSELTDATGDRTTNDESLTTRISNAEDTREAALSTLSGDRISADASVETLLSAAISERTAAISVLQSTRDVSDGLISDALSAAISLRISDLDDLSGLINTGLNLVGNELQTAIDNRESAIEELESERISAINSVETLKNELSAEVSTTVSTISGAINFVESNTDPAAVDSLTEMLTAFQGADAAIVATISGLDISANAMTYSTDQRLDYLEKYCKALSSFLHIVDPDNNIAIEFPPSTVAMVSVYDNVDVSYGSYTYYPLDTSGWVAATGTTGGVVNQAGEDAAGVTGE
jgi:hypothetical protein